MLIIFVGKLSKESLPVSNHISRNSIVPKPWQLDLMFFKNKMNIVVHYH